MPSITDRRIHDHFRLRCRHLSVNEHHTTRDAAFRTLLMSRSHVQIIFDWARSLPIVIGLPALAICLWQGVSLVRSRDPRSTRTLDAFLDDRCGSK